jgi:REP-associated tyrosine transposase
MHPPLVSPTRHAHSATTLLVHVVWSTHGRARSLDPSFDPRLALVLETTARRVGCALLAVGNAADHVHTLVRHPPTLAVAELAQRLKGASARALLPALQRRGDHLWQAGYWAETVAPHDLRAVVAYIRDQRTHHELADLREPWETT